MIYNDFEFLICSPFNLEKLTCEIYYKKELIAEISQESDDLLLEIYPPQNQEWWSLSLEEFQEALEKAKQHLVN